MITIPYPYVQPASAPFPVLPTLAPVGICNSYAESFGYVIAMDTYDIDAQTSGYTIDESLAFFDRQSYNRKVNDIRQARYSAVSRLLASRPPRRALSHCCGAYHKSARHSA